MQQTRSWVSGEGGVTDSVLGGQQPPESYGCDDATTHAWTAIGGHDAGCTPDPFGPWVASPRRIGVRQVLASSAATRSGGFPAD